MRPEQARDLSKILFLDIETVPQEWEWEKLDPITASLFNAKTRSEQERREKSVEQMYSERAGILAEFGKVICIGVGRMEEVSGEWHLRVTSFQGDDEAMILRQFTGLLDRHYHTDEHWLCGHNAKEFDFPFIARRCVINRVRPPKLLDISGLKPWEVGQLDTMALWCFGDRKAWTSLALLAHVLGVETPKGDISGADVARVYHVDHDLDRIASYCRRDVVATAQVYLRLTGRDTIPEGHITIV
jgi:3'-5' exonuclease